ncbi:hypothetical protein KAR91_41915 [Candidatus Pacearchaeota archaeon]|nr:hypothetical protein [Candidatus Pacearchaeota archaeon]
MGKKTDNMFPCHSIPFSEEGRESFDRIFSNKDGNEECHEDIVPGDEESGD